MIGFTILRFTRWGLLLGALLICNLNAADLDITKETDSFGFLKPIPVNISGFSGEVDSVLKQDLIFMGIVNVSPDQAHYLISGSNSSRLEGRVVNRATKQQVFGRAYTGGSVRAQTHRFADDIAMELTRLPGIAQKKITFKVEAGLGRSEAYIADYDGHNARAVTQDKS